MTLHLIKLCVGAASIEELADWQAARAAEQKKAGKKPRIFHTTFQTPKRDAELLDGGSLYWVIKGTVQVRQKLVGFEQGTEVGRHALPASSCSIPRSCRCARCPAAPSRAGAT